MLSLPVSEELRLPALPHHAGQARMFIRQHALRLGFAAGPSSEIEVAVGEAVANAIEHGCKARSTSQETGTCEVVVAALWDGEVFVVSVTDDGPGFAPQAAPRTEASDAEAERGRGLLMMELLMDEVQFFHAPGGMTVRMSRRLHPARS